jgi:hypothetical protein
MAWLRITQLGCDMATLRQIASWFDGRRGVVAAVLIGWVALIVIGAGDKSGAAGRFGVPDGRAIFEWFMVVVALICLLVLPFVISTRTGRPDVQRKRSKSLLVLLAMALIFSFGPDLREWLNGLGSEDGGSNVAALPTASPAESTALNDSLTLLVVICVVAAASLLWTRRRLAAALDEAGELTLEDAIGPALDQATRRLLSTDDPRLAVLAAYASLETSLTDLGRSREASETVTEHLTRVLVEVPVVTGPAVRLGELYELARFSDHPITRADQQEAADALGQARSKLPPVARVAT